MRSTRRIVPLVIGVTAAIGIAGVAAVALPGVTSRAPVVVDPVQTDGSAAAVAVPKPAADVDEPQDEPAPKADPTKVVAAHDSFRQVSDEIRVAMAAKEAEWVAEKKAREQLAAEKAAQEEAAKQAAAKEQQARDAAAKEQAEKDQSKKEQAAKLPVDEPKKDATHKEPVDKPKKDGGEKDEQHDAWWPEHVWAHAQSCDQVDLDAGTVTGTWHLWLKYGGDWTYASASPSPSKIQHHGDKVRLDHSATATVVKTGDGWSKAKAGPVQVTVNGPDGQSKTFAVDLWVKVGADGTCHL